MFVHSSIAGVIQCLKDRMKVDELPHEVNGVCVNGRQLLSGAKRGRENAMMKVQ